MSTPMMQDEYEHDGAAALPPHDRQAEQSVLGAVLLSSEALAELVSVVHAEDFYRPAHQAIYRAAVDLYSDGTPVDAITVADELGRRGELSRCGDAPYLHTLMATVPTATNAGYYADIVARQATLRRLGEAGGRIAQFAQLGNTDGAPELGEVLTRAQHALDTATGTHQVQSTVADVAAMSQPLLDYLDGIQTGAADQHIVPTGLPDLDAVIGGLRPGQMITVAARPGIGKSAVGVQFLRSAAIDHDMPAVLFSLEMGKNEIMSRALSAESSIRLDAMRRKHGLNDDDWTRIATTLGRINEAPLLVDDSPNLTIPEIKAKSRALARQRGLRLIVVDYLQLMTSASRVENRQQEVAEFSRQLKLLAKELDVPVVAISQLNRGSEQRADKRPMLSDLRESGAIEQDSDIVILLDRPDARETDDPRAGEVDLILAKHRDGPMCRITTLHQLHYSRLANLAGE